MILYRFIFELAGVPAGTVELTVAPQEYVYRSRQVYLRRSAERSDKFPHDAQPIPEGLWLLRKPARGCVDGVAEVTHQTGKLCADEVTLTQVKGTLFTKPFTATYDPRRGMTELVVGKSRFVRSDQPLAAGQPYADGFPVEGKGRMLALEPPVEGARNSHPVGTRQAPAEEGSCLELAQAFVGESGDRRLVLGLVVEGGRAFPHAWATSRSGDVDPSAREGVVEGVYLELPRERAGQLYVELLDGTRKLVWKP